MKGYKGFNKGMICRGKQYKENTVFEEPEANICVNGMHFCENPFDVLDYYGFVNYNGELNEFAEVESLDEVKTNDSKKYCTKKLKIGAKLSLAKFIRACAERAENLNHSKDFNKISSSISNIRLGSLGDSAQIGSSGDFAKIANSGRCAKIGSSGYAARISSSGNSAKIANLGYSARIANLGDSAQIANLGDSAQIANSGDAARISSSGENCVICCTGDASRVKAKKGSWITLSEWRWDEEEEVCVLVCVKTEQVDGERIKEDVFYTLRDGEFQEVKP